MPHEIITSIYLCTRILLSSHTSRLLRSVLRISHTLRTDGGGRVRFYKRILSILSHFFISFDRRMTTVKGCGATLSYRNKNRVYLGPPKAVFTGNEWKGVNVDAIKNDRSVWISVRMCVFQDMHKGAALCVRAWLLYAVYVTERSSYL